MVKKEKYTLLKSITLKHLRNNMLGSHFGVNPSSMMTQLQIALRKQINLSKLRITANKYHKKFTIKQLHKKIGTSLHAHLTKFLLKRVNGKKFMF